MSYSTDTPYFMQDYPEYGKHDSHGWKTIHGYIYEAKKLAYCIVKNCFIYSEAVISFDADFSEDYHKTYWNRTCRNLASKGIVAIYVRELNKCGRRIHYHLLIANQTPHDEVKETILNSLPKEIRSVSRVHLEGVHKGQWTMIKYVLKGRVQGEVNGIYSRDVYASKRRLFTKECKLRKYGSIGDFWLRSKESIWRDCIRHEQMLAKYMTLEVMMQAREIASCIDDRYPWRQIARNIASHEMKLEKYRESLGENKSPNSI